MTFELRPVGERAFLIDLTDAQERRRVDAALRRTSIDGVVEQVAAATTVLVRCTDPDAVAGVAAAVRALDLTEEAHGNEATSDVVELRVRYDGEDLDWVAEHLGIDADEVVSRHTGQLWTVEFAGFMPGFGYLIGSDGGLTVPRRESPRTRIPAGSVALGGDFTGLYPRSSPGGWQLIGTSDVDLWNADRTPPALLVPGTRVRFVEEDR